MPSADLSGFGKAMFEKRMRERNMGMDPFGNPKGPMMPTEPGLNEVQRDRLREIMETTRTEGQPFNTGFDNSALMKDPKFKQEDTMNQGMEVSEPYEEANKQAFSKNNPMNAISQETPIGDRVSDFLMGIYKQRMDGGDSTNSKFGKRVLGGLADFATLGMTDFDKRSR